MMKSLKAVSIAALLPTTFFPTAAPKRPSAQVVTVTAVEYGFEAPASIAAGTVTLKLVNKGKELHHITLAKLEEGHTIADLQSAPPDAPPPVWFKMIGGPNAPVPGGGVAEATLTLDAGNYVLLCFIPSNDGKPHFMKGMMKPLTVTGAKGTPVEPRADVTIKLVDYGFDITGQVAAGKRVIHVVNQAGQPHELFLARLNPGKSATDLAQWAEKLEGPPPGVPMGGATPMEKGRSVYLNVTLEAGKYALLCFVPDAKDGKPHVQHGMTTQFKIS